MPLLEDHSVSFIVRIWRELGDGSGSCQEWRGSIEHVLSGDRSFFRDLSAIAKFMQPHLKQIGIEAPLRFWDVMRPELGESTSAAQEVPAQPLQVSSSNAKPRRRRS